jgi:DNA-binding LytR/AlgR family response regulator
MGKMLPAEDFMLVHKSYIIINKTKVTKFVGNLLEIDCFQIPVSRSKKESIIQFCFFKLSI